MGDGSRCLIADVTFNDIVAFFVEMGALVALFAWGLKTGSSLAPRLLLGLGLPAMAIALWALFASPRSVFDVLAAEVVVKVLVLGGAVLATFALIPFWWAVTVGVVVAANTLLLYVGPFAR